MDNDILNVESGLMMSANHLAGKSEMADDILFTESSVERSNASKKSGFFRSRKDSPMQTPEEIAEEVEQQNEIYEEFSSDFDGIDNIEDEANADRIEAAADMHDVACPYSHTCDYTMIPDPNEGEVTSTSQS